MSKRKGSGTQSMKHSEDSEAGANGVTTFHSDQTGNLSLPMRCHQFCNIKRIKVFKQKRHWCRKVVQCDQWILGIKVLYRMKFWNIKTALHFQLHNEISHNSATFLIRWEVYLVISHETVDTRAEGSHFGSCIHWDRIKISASTFWHLIEASSVEPINSGS